MLLSMTKNVIITIEKLVNCNIL